MRKEQPVKKIVRQLRHGQITIPKELREALGLREEDLLSITLSNGKLEIEPVRLAPRGTASAWARQLYDEFAPMRRSLKGRTEEEINEAIRKAVEETRAGS